MPKNTSVTLSDHFQQFIEEQVASGRFHSASEVIREGLRLAEIEAKKRENLIKLIREGQESGYSVPFDNEAFKKKMREKYASAHVEG